MSRKPAPIRRRSAPARRGFPVFWVAVGLVALAGVVAVVATRGGGGAPTTSGAGETRPVTVDGDALPPFVEGGADPAVGRLAPAVRGSRLDGTPLAIEPADGVAKVVVFLAHWCPHCQREVPRIVSWLGRYGLPPGVRLVAVATSTSRDRPNWPPSAWLARERWDVPTLADDARGSAAAAFGLTGFPYFVALDRDGRVLARASGELTDQAFARLLELAATG
jgi:thiol-disulfide isomerase/thioredoxin